MPTYVKDPNAVLDYGFDWSDWLQSGETIASSAWEVTPSGISIDSNDFSDYVTSVWLSEGVAGVTYIGRNRIVTSDSRTEDRSFDLIVKNR